jgi:hypothetical protein
VSRAPKPVDEPGDPAPRQDDPLGEDVHPDPPAGGVGDLEEGVVLRKRQAVGRLELLVEAPGDPGVGVQEAPPRAHAGNVGDDRTRRRRRARAGPVGRSDVGRGRHDRPIVLAELLIDKSTISQYRCMVNDMTSTNTRARP